MFPFVYTICNFIIHLLFTNVGLVLTVCLLISPLEIPLNSLIQMVSWSKFVAGLFLNPSVISLFNWWVCSQFSSLFSACFSACRLGSFRPGFHYTTNTTTTTQKQSDYKVEQSSFTLIALFLLETGRCRGRNWLNGDQALGLICTCFFNGCRAYCISNSGSVI